VISSAAKPISAPASAGGVLGRCVGDPERFLADTWGVSAAVHPAVGRGFDDLLALGDVDRILTTTSLRTPSFRLVKAGEQIPEAAYTRSGRTGSKPVSGMADAARIAELFDDGATIVLQGLHRNWEPVAAFCRSLEIDLGHPCQVNAYITPPGSQGLALHADPHDVFVLQAFGRKRWEIHPAPAENARDPIDADVGPGDCIYMPAGTPHAAAAQSAISGHLTVGVHVVAWREVLADAWRSALEGPEFDGSIPVGWTRDLELFADALRLKLDRAVAALTTLHADDLVEERIRRFLSTRAQLLRGILLQRADVDGIHDGTVLLRRSGSVCEIRPSGNVLTVLLGDRRLEMPPWLEPAMRQIAASERVVVGDLAPTVPREDARLVLARRLIREGLLLAEPDR
jgi:bifunctional lysine-specific demethylase and histidyl-hydroxylase NO66